MLETCGSVVGAYPPNDRIDGLKRKADVAASVGMVRLVLTVVAENGVSRDGISLLDEVVREGAWLMLAAVSEAEVDAYLAKLAGELDERGRRLAVRNGHAEPRQVMTAAGAVEVRAPRVNDKRIDAANGKGETVPVGGSAAMVPAEPEGGRGAAAAVPARVVQRRLCARAGVVPGLGRRAVGGHDHPVDQAVDRRLSRLHPTRSIYCGLRVRVGRRRARQRPPGGRQAVPAGHRRGTRRWHQRAGRPHRSLPGVDRAVGRPAA